MSGKTVISLFVMIAIGMIAGGCENVSKAMDKIKAQKHFEQGEEYSKLDEEDKAIEEYKKAIELDPSNPEYYFREGVAYLRKSGKGKLEYAPDDPERKRLWDLGLQKYKKSISIDPNYIMAHRGLAYAYKQMGLYDKAIEECRFVIENSEHPCDKEAGHKILGEIYEAMGRQEEAEKEKKIAHEIFKADLDIITEVSEAKKHVKKGDDYFIDENYSQAIEEYKHALEYDTTNARIYANLGNCYLQKMIPWWEKIKEELDQGREIESTPEWRKVEALRKEALKYLNKALSLDPEDVHTHLYLAVYYATNDQYEEAIKEYQFVLESERTKMIEKYHVHQQLKEIYELLERPEEVEKEEKWLKETKEKYGIGIKSLW